RGVDVAFGGELLQGLRRIARRVDGDHEYAQLFTLRGCELALGNAQRVDDERAGGLATGIEHRDQHRVTAVQVESARLAGLVGECRVEVIQGGRRIGVARQQRVGTR